MYCSKCGAKNLDTDLFCYTCGSPLKNNKSPYLPETEYSPKPADSLSPDTSADPTNILFRPYTGEPEPETPALRHAFRQETPANTTTNMVSKEYETPPMQETAEPTLTEYISPAPDPQEEPIREEPLAPPMMQQTESYTSPTENAPFVWRKPDNPAQNTVVSNPTPPIEPPAPPHSWVEVLEEETEEQPTKPVAELPEAVKTDEILPNNPEAPLPEPMKQTRKKKKKRIFPRVFMVLLTLLLLIGGSVLVLAQTKPELVKRWLPHSISEPLTTFSFGSDYQPTEINSSSLPQTTLNQLTLASLDQTLWPHIETIYTSYSELALVEQALQFSHYPAQQPAYKQLLEHCKNDMAQIIQTLPPAQSQQEENYINAIRNCATLLEQQADSLLAENSTAKTTTVGINDFFPKFQKAFSHLLEQRTTLYEASGYTRGEAEYIVQSQLSETAFRMQTILDALRIQT